MVDKVSKTPQVIELENSNFPRMNYLDNVLT